MSRNTPPTRSNLLEVFSQFDRSEPLVSRTMQPSYLRALRPSTDDAATMDTCNTVPDEPEPQQQATDSVNQPESIDSSSYMNVNQAALRNFVKDEVERQVADPLQYSNRIAVEETFMDTT